MKNWRFKAVLAAMAVACTLTIACGGGKSPDTGTAPTSDFPAPTAAATPAPVPAALPATEGCSITKLKEGLKWTVGDGTVTFRLTNTTGHDCPGDDAGTIWFVNYAMKDGVNQVFFDGPVNVGKLKKDETIEHTLKTPCEAWQADLSFSQPVQPPAFSPGYLIGHKFGGAETNSKCTPPEQECVPARVDISLSQGETSAQALTASVVSPGQTFWFTVNAANGATVIVDFGDGSPTETVTGPFPKSVSHQYAFVSADKDYIVTASPISGKFCPGKDTVTVRVRKYECYDFAPAGPITGDIGVDIQPTVVNFSVGTVGPAGVTFANETLPASKPRPDYGQSAGSFSTTGTLAHSPAEGLSCPLEKKFTKEIPPKPCENVQTGSFTVKADTHVNGSYDYRVCTETVTALGYKTCKAGTIVWTGNLPKNGNSGPVDYPVNGKTLFVQVKPLLLWEGIDESVVAKCAEYKAAWNESISFNCKNSCDIR